MDCARHAENLTASADGELRGLARIGLALHLVVCRPCANRLQSLRAGVAAQRQALAAVESVDVEALLASARAAIAVLGEPRPPTPAPAASTSPWGRWAVPSLAALMLAVVLGAAIAGTGGLRPMLVALGVEAPPRQLVRNPELFRDYEIIRELEFLEHLDELEETPVDDERAALGLVRFG